MTTSASNSSSPSVAFFEPEDRLLTATRAWLIWLQGLFKSRPYGHYHWEDNPDETEVVITDQFPSSGPSTNRRPLIVTSRGPAMWSGTSVDRVMEQDLLGRRKVYTDLMGSSMTISVIAREGLEAQNIAYMIFRMIPVFAPQLLRLGRMHMLGNNVQLTPETPHNALVQGSSTPEWKQVQLVIPFYIQDVISSEDNGFYTMFRDVTVHMGLANNEG